MERVKIVFIKTRAPLDGFSDENGVFFLGALGNKVYMDINNEYKHHIVVVYKGGQA